MLIRVGLEDVRQSSACRLKAVSWKVTNELDRPSWAQRYGFWSQGLNNGALIEWDLETRALLEAFLDGQAEAVELLIPDDVLENATPGTTITEMAKFR